VTDGLIRQLFSFWPYSWSSSSGKSQKNQKFVPPLPLSQSSSPSSPMIPSFLDKRLPEESNCEESEKTVSDGGSDGTLEIDISNSEKESLLQDESQSFDTNMNMVGIFYATGPIQRPSRRTQFSSRQLEKYAYEK
jgi:hypothetical protein